MFDVLSLHVVLAIVQCDDAERKCKRLCIVQVIGTKAVQVAAPAVRERPLKRPQGPGNQVVERKRKADATLDALAARPAHASSGELTKGVSMAHVFICQMKQCLHWCKTATSSCYSTPVAVGIQHYTGGSRCWGGGIWQSPLSNSCNQSVADMSTFALQYVSTQYRCCVCGDCAALQVLCDCLAVNTININSKMRYNYF